jgi:hypothetical protein
VPDHLLRLGTAVILGAVLVGCAQNTTQAPENGHPGIPAFPDAYYHTLEEEGKAVFRIDPPQSLMVMEVRRSGSLAQFGHDHVVASHDVQGYIAPDEGRADFFVPLDALVVDEGPLRAKAGFDTQPSASDIAGTRNNMLVKVLETASYPYAQIAIRDVAPDADRTIMATVTLHGQTRLVEATIQLKRTADELEVDGTSRVKLSDFGITPYSTLGGALAIQDDVDIKFMIHDRRVGRQAGVSE